MAQLYFQAEEKLKEEFLISSPSLSCLIYLIGRNFDGQKFRQKKFFGRKKFRQTEFSAPTRNFGSFVRRKFFVGFLFPHSIDKNNMF